MSRRAKRRSAVPDGPAEVELAIERLAAGGDGVAHLPDGRVVFVAFAAPGDRARVRLTEQRKRFARGEILELLEASPQRVDPRCAVHGRCGGCSWQHLDYAAQCEAKREILRDAIERIGGLPLETAPSLTPSPPFGYRVRARILAEHGRIGYRERGSHALCSVDACPVLVPALEAALPDATVRGAAAGPRHELSLELDGEGTVRVQEQPRDTKSGEAPPPGAAVAFELSTPGGALRISPGVFAQANGPLLSDFVARVVALLAPQPGARLLELHAGAGLFTLALAARVESLVAVESSRSAASDLRHNLGLAGHRNAEIACTTAEQWLTEKRADASLHFDQVLLDPPRTGLGEEASRDLASLGAGRIVYVSCDPATLARDLRVLRMNGYALRSVEAFDLFPQTPHIEAIASLERM